MHNLILLALAPLVLGSDLSKRFALLPRQGSDAFTPGIGGFVTSCANICGSDTCIYPDEGDTCCIENYGCPGGSFCLTKGYCCPNGDDPATCASENGITLPSGFKANQTIPAGASPSSAAPVSSSPATTRASSSPVSVTSVFTSSATKPFPTPVTNATVTSPSSTTSVSVAQFTGGAMRFVVDGVAAAAVVGAMGLLV